MHQNWTFYIEAGFLNKIPASGPLCGRITTIKCDRRWQLAALKLCSVGSHSEKSISISWAFKLDCGRSRELCEDHLLRRQQRIWEILLPLQCKSTTGYSFNTLYAAPPPHRHISLPAVSILVWTAECREPHEILTLMCHPSSSPRPSSKAC